jgi:hypothetical protein
MLAGGDPLPAGQRRDALAPARDERPPRAYPQGAEPQ